MAYSVKTRILRYEEEVALSLFFCNVEKFKWLLESECFSPSVLTDPVKIGCKELAPYIITAGYKKMLNYPAYEDLRKRNDIIAEIIESKYNISLNLDISFDWDNDIPQFGALYNKRKTDCTNESNFDLMNSIGKLDIPNTRRLLISGADPLQIIKDTDWTIYSEFMSRYYCTKDSYDPGKEDWDKMLSSIAHFFPTYVLKEQMKTLLNQFIPEDIQRDVMRSVKEKWDNITSSAGTNDLILDSGLKEFLNGLDQPGSVLAVMDEDKLTYRFSPDIMNAYEKVLDYIMTELKYLSVRVGGNSYRSGNHMASIMREKNYPTGRFVNLTHHKSEAKATFTEPNVREIDMRNFDFTKDRELVEYADGFDIRSMHYNGSSHSLVWYYLNNISCGWFKKDGEFMPFNSNIKGLWMLTEVAKVKGFMDMKPASAVLYSNMIRSHTNGIACNIIRLCDDLNIKSFDIASTLDL